MNMQQFRRYGLASLLLLSGTAAALADEMSPAPAADMMVLKDSVASTGTVRASKLIDTTVFDPAGERVGYISDIVIDRSYGSVDYTVIRHGAPGIGKQLAVPYKALALGGPADDHIYVQLPLDVVKKAPGFDEANWPIEASADYYRSLDTYYSTRLGSAVARTTPPDASEKAQVVSSVIEPSSMLWSRRVESLRGRDVISPTGEKLGSIKDLVLDNKTGQIRYAVLAHADGQPMLSKYYAVPLNRFRLDAANQKLVLDVSQAELKSIPSFDKDRWPAQPDPRWTTPAPAMGQMK